MIAAVFGRNVGTDRHVPKWLEIGVSEPTTSMIYSYTKRITVYSQTAILWERVLAKHHVLNG